MDLDQEPAVFIYADFNAVEGYASDNELCRIGLTGYGTLASLNEHKIKLFEGLHLRLSDQDELGVVAEFFLTQAALLQTVLVGLVSLNAMNYLKLR